LVSYAYSDTEKGNDAPPAQEVNVIDAKEKESDGFIASIVKSMTEEAHIKVGYGIVQWKMVLERSSDGATATMIHRDESALFLSYGSKPSFFKESSFGYTFMVNYVDFDMKNQEVPGDKYADFGTEVKGYLVYAVPTLYYQWGEHRYKGKFVRIGLGVGVGAGRFSGTVKMSTGDIVYTEKRNFEPRLAISNFIEARWNHIGISFSYASPRIYGDGYDVRVADVSANIGYAFYF
jgi:hypothetical protein